MLNYAGLCSQGSITDAPNEFILYFHLSSTVCSKTHKLLSRAPDCRYASSSSRYSIWFVLFLTFAHSLLVLIRQRLPLFRLVQFPWRFDSQTHFLLFPTCGKFGTLRLCCSERGHLHNEFVFGVSKSPSESFRHPVWSQTNHIISIGWHTK